MSEDQSASRSERAVTEPEVEAAARVLADTALIDAPKLGAQEWMGLARHILMQAAAAAPRSEQLFTKREAEMLNSAAGLVLAGEWPWEPEKPGDRDALESARDKL